MEKAKKERLQKKGWKVGSADEFLGLTPEEAAYIELKYACTKYLKECRQHKRMTQVAAAKYLKSSQSRVAKMEAGDPTVSIDLLIRSLFALGATKKGLAQVIERADLRMAG
ncbi:MAG: XRE family transcriptional regulator [Deltaproteobacteria bacterium]|nr:MAG: XRE family transcriptional regulator [Deltaproteobacteria bacterium]